MKKLLSGITAMMLVLGLFTTGVQASVVTNEKMTYEEVVQMVEQADKQIYSEIQKATDEANNLVEWYQKMLSIVPKTESTQESINHIEVVSKELSMLGKVYGSASGIYEPLKGIDNLNTKMSYLQSKIVDTYSYAVDIYTNIINKQFNRELDRIIERLITVTNKIAQDVIKKAAESGFVVKSEWIEVKIGGRVVLVDPIISDGL